MLWRIAIFLGGLTFIQTGYSVLTDPTCQRVSLSGFRFFTTSCTTQGHGLPTVLIGVLSILIGFGISSGNAAYTYFIWAEAKIAKNLIPSQYSESDLENIVSEKMTQIQSKIVSIGGGTSVVLILVLFFITVIEREINISHFKSDLNNTSVCDKALTAESNFNKSFNAAGAAKDGQTQIDELNKIAEKFVEYSAEANTNLRAVLVSEANAYSLIATSATNNDSASIKKAESILTADSSLFVAACLPK
jgi:uncharacterized membrane protein